MLARLGTSRWRRVAARWALLRPRLVATTSNELRCSSIPNVDKRKNSPTSLAVLALATVSQAATCDSRKDPKKKKKTSMSQDDQNAGSPCVGDGKCCSDATADTRAKCYDPPDHFLFPNIEPYKTGHLQVSDLHSLYYEECGNPNGKPVIIVHGGSGGGCDANMRRFHDPQVYRIILVDQRGAGRSKPWASLEDNTTWHLIEDMEKVRRHLRIDKWQVFGGSWGSTLSLAYAINHPTRVSELVLRGLFLFRKQELDFYNQFGAHFFFPDLWEVYRDAIPEEERGDFVKAYHKRVNSDDPHKRKAASIAWVLWECGTSNLIPPPNMAEMIESESESEIELVEAFARIETHYFVRKGFFPSNEYLIENAFKIRHIPTVLVQGRYDLVCPMQSAWDFRKVCPKVDLRVVPTAGHSAMDPGITHELVAATNRFRLSTI